ncbi:MAG: hypothetical protein ACYDBQ_04885 [Thermoplasmatota archaeon]
MAHGRRGGMGAMAGVLLLSVLSVLPAPPVAGAAAGCAGSLCLPWAPALGPQPVESACASGAGTSAYVGPSCWAGTPNCGSVGYAALCVCGPRAPGDCTGAEVDQTVCATTTGGVAQGVGYQGTHCGDGSASCGTEGAGPQPAGACSPVCAPQPGTIVNVCTCDSLLNSPGDVDCNSQTVAQQNGIVCTPAQTLTPNCGPNNSVNPGGTLDYWAITCPYPQSGAPTDSIIAAGRFNFDGASQSSITAGLLNVITCNSRASFIGAGANNLVDATYASIVAGNNNTARGSAATIGAGVANVATGPASGIFVGLENAATGTASNVFVGGSNIAGMDYGSITAGTNNHLAGTPEGAATYGCNELAPGQNALVAQSPPVKVACNGFIAGGNLNTAQAGGSVIAVGRENTILAPAENAFIAGGEDNVATAADAVIVAGTHNVATADNAAVLAGDYSNAGGLQSFVGAGSMGNASQLGAVVLAGVNDAAGGSDSVVAGGYHNVVSALSTGAAIAAGTQNVAGGEYATIGAGFSNAAAGRASTVFAGEKNVAAGDGSTVDGGTGNSATGASSTVGGGSGNTASGLNGVVGSGEKNVAAGAQSVVAGGFSNTAAGASSTVGGGQENDAVADDSTIPGGFQAQTTSTGEWAYASGAFPSSSQSGPQLGSAQAGVYVLRGSVTGSTGVASTRLSTDGSSTPASGASPPTGAPVSGTGAGSGQLIVKPNTMMIFRVDCIATDATGSMKSWYYSGTAVNRPGGFVVGVNQNAVIAGDPGASAWSCTVGQDPGDAIAVTGSAAGQVNFAATIRTTEVSI